MHLKTGQNYSLSQNENCKQRQLKSGDCDTIIHTVEKSENKCDKLKKKCLFYKLVIYCSIIGQSILGTSMMSHHLVKEYQYSLSGTNPE